MLSEKLFQAFKSSDPMEQLANLDKIRVPTNPQTEDDIKANHFDRLGTCDHCDHILPLNAYSACKECECLIGGCNHD